MYAIIKTGGKQYRVKEGDIIDVELLKDSESDKISFNDILLLNTGNSVKIGTPNLTATVQGEILDEVKGEKLIVFKYKRRKNCKVKKGHRQKHTRVKITAIQEGN